MKKRKVLVLKRDSMGAWSACYQGYITEVAGGWMKVKEYFWSKGEWLPAISDIIQTINIRESNLGLWREPEIKEEGKMGFDVEKEESKSKKKKGKK